MTTGRRRLVFLILVVVAVGIGVWWTTWGQQWRQEVAVDIGMKDYAKRWPERVAAFKSQPDEWQLLALAAFALDKDLFDPPRPALAEAALRLAMRRGSRDAALDLGVLYRDGKLGMPDTDKALSLFDKVREGTEPAARAGEASALIVMGRIYAEGLGVHADQAKAFEMTLRGAANGTAEQKYSIGRDYAFGHGVFNGRASESEGLRLIEEAARAGSADAMEYVGKELTFRADRREREIAGFDASTDRRQAYDWFVKAAQLGLTSAMSYAGRTAWDLGDISAAEKWLEAAHRAGIDDEPEVLGLIRLIRATGPISTIGPGADMMVKAYIKQDERIWPVLAQWDAAGAISRMPAGTQERHRAVLVSLGWLFVSERLGLSKVVDRDPLDAHLRTLTRQGRAELTAEARTLADVILASSARAAAPGGQLASGSPGSAHSIAPSTAVVGRAPSAHSAQASLDQYYNPFLDIPAEPAASRAATAPATAKKAVTRQQSAPQAEPPPQDSSGYLRGEPQASQQGLSTFAIDNTRGTAGAIVRLYREGKMPAAYSFFVKQGESFTGTGVVAGSYVMRYRNLGSGNVYEADKRFDFSEIETVEGTRFSRARITLYGVPGGNMKTLPVAESKF